MQTVNHSLWFVLSEKLRMLELKNRKQKQKEKSMKSKILSCFVLASILALTGCVKCTIASADKSFILTHRTYGLFMDIKVSSPSANQAPSITGGLGGEFDQITPEYASTNHIDVATAAFTTGSGESQSGSSSSLTQSGGDWLTAGSAAVFHSTNILASPATNYPAPQKGQ
jgi:hypothetical protein